MQLTTIKDLCKGKSFLQVCKDCKIGINTLSKLTTGKSVADNLTIKTVKSLADYFGLDLEKMYQVLVASEKINA